WGDLTRGPRVINDETKARMQEVLTEIQDGTFASEWVKENESGKLRYDELLTEDLDRQLETVGRDLRGRMSWLQN
ncbi:MAG: ketol-acid reductoisomerase, partial [Gammaproteobacteria bacterium]